MFSKFKVPYIGNFLHREILAKMTLGRCVKFSLSPIFPISRTLNEDVKYGLFFAVSIFGNFREVANSGKIKPTQKIPDIRYILMRYNHLNCLSPLKYLSNSAYWFVFRTPHKYKQSIKQLIDCDIKMEFFNQSSHVEPSLYNNRT